MIITTLIVTVVGEQLSSVVAFREAVEDEGLGAHHSRFVAHDYRHDDAC